MVSRSMPVRKWRPVARRAKRVRRVLRRFISKTPRSSQVFNYKRTFYGGNWTPSTALTSGFWQYFSFTLSQMPNSTEIINLFDRVCVRGIKVTFRPRYDNFAGNDTVDTAAPGVTAQGTTLIHIINDPFSNVAPSGTYTSATLNSFLENGKVKSYPGTRAVSVYYKPATITHAGLRQVNQWFETSANPSLNGFHAFVQDVNLTGTFNQSWDYFVTYYMQCKGNK